jgi:transposase
MQTQATKEPQFALPELSSDVSELQSMIVDLHKQMDEISGSYECENKLLRERVKYLQQQLYCRKSEKLSLSDDNYSPSFLFGDLPEESKEEPEPLVEEITIPSHKRKKRGRKPLPESLPRVEVVHDLPEEEKRCGCGCEKSRIGEEVSEQLEMQPARFWVVRHIRYKYACKNCEGLDGRKGEKSVTIAPPPVQLIPKSIATPSLLAHILVSKYSDSLPFYRQEQQFSRYGFKLSRTNMCNWTQEVSRKSQPLVELLREYLLSSPFIQIDETPFQVLREPGRSFESKSYMWLFRGGPPGKEVVLYRYDPGRSGKVAADFLGDYRGFVQTDGYSGYNFLDRNPGIVHVGCWAHVRRKFFDVVKVSGKGKVKGKGGMGKAGEALRTIRALYAIEKDARNRELCPEEVYRERQEKAKPILDEFEIWVKETSLKVPPKSLLGKALFYTLAQWPRLVRYLEDGIINIDNNWIENAVRPFAVGRKNWLFSDRPVGAAASATMYSIIETAKSNNLEPYHYLCYLFDRLPYAHTTEEFRKLLPQNLTPEILTDHYSKMFRWA